MQQMLAGLDELAQAEIWTEIEHALQQFETSDGFESPCRLLVCSGVAERSWCVRPPSDVVSASRQRR
jgi:hypothetical protein